MNHRNIDTEIPEGFKMTELGPLPEEWDIHRLGDLAKTHTGGTPNRNKPKYWQGKIPWLKSGELNDRKVFSSNEFITEEGLSNSSARFVESGTLLIAMYGATAGKVGLAQSRFTINQAICAVIPNKDFLSEFYFYYMINIRGSLLSKRFGGAQPNLNQQVLRDLKIAKPPPLEQKKIATVLFAVQEAKEKTEEVIKATKEFKKSLMKHLFTYGPVPVGEAEKVRLKETEIGMVPEEWRRVQLGEVGDVKYGYSTAIPKTSEHLGTPIISMADITKEGHILWHKIRKISIDKKLAEKHRLTQGEVLFNWRNSPKYVGKTAVFNPDQNPSHICASFLLRIIPKEINNYFLHYFISLKRLQGHFAMKSRRAVGQTNFNATVLKKMQIPLPDPAIQLKIATFLSSVDRRILAEENKKKALEELFKTLLNDLMTGKIRVKDLDIKEAL